MTLLDHALSIFGAFVLVGLAVLILTRCTDETRPLSSLEVIKADRLCRELEMDVEFEYVDGEVTWYRCVSRP